MQTKADHASARPAPTAGAPPALMLAALVLAAAPAAEAQTSVDAPAAPQAAPPTLAPGAGALIIDQDRLDRRAPAPVAPAPATPRPPTETAAQAAPSVTLRQVRLEGSTALAGEIDAIARPFVGRPLDTAGIRAVADAVSAAYGRSGLALYTIVAPQQDLSGGVLTLRAVEGRIVAVNVTGPRVGEKNKLIRAYAERLTKENPLTRRTLERYLSLIRDIPGVTVDAQLFNAGPAGALRLELKVQQKRFQHDIAFNTRGTPRLGAAQVIASAMGNSVLTQGDQVRATVSVPTAVERFQFGALAYSVPLGSDGLTAVANASYLRTRPKNPPVKGDAFAAGLQLSYPIVRGYKQSLYASGGLDMLNSDNAIYGQQLTSDRQRTLRAGLSYASAAARRSLSASVTGGLGLEGLGARVDERLSDPDFKKATFQGALNQAVGKRVALRLRVMAQVSDGRLPSTEQMPLGGETFGRAFASAVVTGDHGYAGSAEVGYVPPIAGKLKGSEVYGFVDGGRAFYRDRLPFVAAVRYDLASAGGGVRFPVGKTLFIGLEAAKAVDAPYPGAGKPWKAIVSWRSVR
jgi:hemolysin activation/secretion protein